jgi:hypothetical protein
LVIILLGHKLLESLFCLVGVANIYGGNEENSKEDGYSVNPTLTPTFLPDSENELDTGCHDKEYDEGITEILHDHVADRLGSTG